MKIIITGTSGFIGAHLLDAAHSIYGAGVVAFSSKSTPGNCIRYKDVADFGLSTVDLAKVREADVLIHAGAFTPKNTKDSQLIAACTSNVSFTEKLLGLPWDNLKKIIFLSTLDVYAEVEGSVSESAPTIPQSLYGMSKLYCERMVELFANDRCITSQILRIGHVYGPGEERYAKVIPRAIQLILAGKDVELWGDGEELRSFIYVKDVVAAIMKSLEYKESLGVVNVVGGNAISVGALLDKLVEIGGRKANIVRKEFLGKKRNFVFDNSKLMKELIVKETDLGIGLLEEFRHIEKKATF